MLFCNLVHNKWLRNNDLYKRYSLPLYLTETTSMLTTRYHSATVSVLPLLKNISSLSEDNSLEMPGKKLYAGFIYSAPINSSLKILDN